MSNAKLVRKRFVTEEIVRRDEVTWENKQGQKEAVTYNGDPVYYDEYPPVSSQKYKYEEPVEDVLPPAPTPTIKPREPSKDTMRDKVFICYSHKDERWLNDLQTHLKPYERNRSVTVWSDEQIQPGAEWFEELKKALSSTKVAILLVTKDFLASDFIHEHELGPLLKRAEKGDVRIIWIPVGACAYKKSPLKNYQAVIDPNKPLANMKPERDNAWVKICEEIEKAVLEK